MTHSFALLHSQMDGYAHPSGQSHVGGPTTAPSVAQSVSNTFNVLPPNYGESAQQFAARIFPMVKAAQQRHRDDIAGAQSLAIAQASMGGSW